VEDDDIEAEYAEWLCNELGIQVDRAKDVEGAIALASNHVYVLYLVDIVLDGTRSGVVFVKHLRQVQGVNTPVMVMSGFEDAARRLQALKSGADDFISKPFSPEEFLWRVRKILLEHAMAENGNRSAAASRSQAKNHSLASLTPREHEICMAILTGTSDKEIALNLGISYWTVRSHIQQIFSKTGALNRRELMTMFIPSSTN
jgi:DNA-binding NarL/FixJ family response regulator